VSYEPLAPHHAARVFAELCDPAMYAFIPDDPPASIEALAERYAQLAAGGPPGETWRNWIILDADAPVGTLQATIYADHRADVAWVVVPRYWRRGHGARGVAWLLATLADEGVTHAEATIDPRNTASRALAAKLGFQDSGLRGGDRVYLREI
jgi:ribosomal-protein-alanine N-acetyltransferase